MPSYPKDPERFRPRVNSSGNLVIFLNGILTRPGDQFGWTDRAEQWFLERTNHDVDSYEYFQTPILGRLFGEARHNREVIELLAGYWNAWDFPPKLHLVAHSRGCEIARRLVVEHGVKVESLHLFAAAIDADFEANGLNAALTQRHVNRVRLYSSKSDGVLRWLAGASLGLYGRLGYTGPRNIAQSLIHRVFTTPRDDFGHSDWFSPRNLPLYMRAVDEEVDDLPI